MSGLRRGQKEATRIVRDAILRALAQGDATSRQIERIMGFVPSDATVHHLRVLEQRGLVRVVGDAPAAGEKHRGGRRALIWALTKAGEQGMAA